MGALWPQIQGVRAEAPVEIVPVLAAKAASVPPLTPPPDWVELIESLRRDIERLRVEGRPPAGRSTPAAPTQPDAANVASPQSVQRTERTANRKRRKKQPAAIQDEWGFFDPEQCGFSALLAKLDEVTAADEMPVEP
jgi:hypothetical protein